MPEVLNYLPVDHLDDEGVAAMARKLGTCFDCGPGDFYLKSQWTFYPRYQVFSTAAPAANGAPGGVPRPLFHVKKLWEDSPLKEVLGLHLLSRVFDRNLGPSDYVFGRYTAGKWLWKHVAWYLCTTWVDGSPLPPEFRRTGAVEFGGRDVTGEVWRALGRQYVAHEVLSLYDVEDRHLLLAVDRVDRRVSLRRIDLGLSFAHLDYGRYRGFEQVFKRADPLDHPEFGEGVEEERAKVVAALGRSEVVSQLRAALEVVTSLRDDHPLCRFAPPLTFKPKQFGRQLADYWRRVVDWAPLAEVVAGVLTG